VIPRMPEVAKQYQSAGVDLLMALVQVAALRMKSDANHELLAKDVSEIKMVMAHRRQLARSIGERCAGGPA